MVNRLFAPSPPFLLAPHVTSSEAISNGLIYILVHLQRQAAVAVAAVVALQVRIVYFRDISTDR